MKLSSTVRAKCIKRERMARQLPVLDGGLGENPSPIPPSIRTALQTHADKKHYASVEGVPELRACFRHKILVGNGLKPLLMIIQLAFHKLHPDGVVVHVLPSWVSYKEQTELLNIPTVDILVDETTQWRLTPTVLEKALKPLKNTPHLILLNSPNNPTGYVFTKNEMEAFGAIFEACGTTVLYDNIYEHMVFPSRMADAGNICNYCTRTITASSLSKNFAAGGYRLGWLEFVPELDPLFDICRCISSYMYTCPTTPVQYAAATALQQGNEIPMYLKFQRTMFENVSKVVLHKLEAMNVGCTKSEGAYYTLMDFEHYASKFKQHNIQTSDDLCVELAKKQGLITVSGTAFGISKPYMLRYSYVDISDIDVEGGSFNFFKIGKFLFTLREWLNKL